MNGHPKPSSVYLGGREERALLHEIEKLPKIPVQVAGYPPRPKWQGLLVFRVNAESHIAFS